MTEAACPGPWRAELPVQWPRDKGDGAQEKGPRRPFWLRRNYQDPEKDGIKLAGSGRMDLLSEAGLVSQR